MSAALFKAGKARAEAPAFRERMAQLVAMQTDAKAGDAAKWTAACLDLMAGWLADLGFVHERHMADGNAFLVARRTEADDLPTVLTYSHGDTVPGMAGDWAEGRDPWTLTEDGPLWYGRGIADNKGQFLVNLTAVEALLEARGSLGFNLVWLIEMGEETGSPGLAEFCAEHGDLLKADVLIASDGPRIAADKPTLFLGARGGVTYRLDLKRVIMRKLYMGIADGRVECDGTTVFEAKDIRVGLFQNTTAEGAS